MSSIKTQCIEREIVKSPLMFSALKPEQIGDISAKTLQIKNAAIFAQLNSMVTFIF